MADWTRQLEPMSPCSTMMTSGCRQAAGANRVHDVAPGVRRRGYLLRHFQQPERPHFTAAEVADDRGIVQITLWQTICGRDVFMTSALMVRRDRIGGIRYGVARGPIEDVQFHIKLMTRGSFGNCGGQNPGDLPRYETNASKNPEFYYGGIKLLREMQKESEIDGLSPLQHRDMSAWLCHIGRITAIGQLFMNRRFRGLELYLRKLFFRHRTDVWVSCSSIRQCFYSRVN